VAEPPDLLASDTDRARVTSELREHYEAGRLTLEEFQERLDEAHGARTEGQLRNVLRQLPGAKPPTVKLRDTRWQSLALQYALVNVVTILVWLFTGAHGGFWPKWVLLGTLFMFMRRTVGRSRRRSLPREPQPPGS
jgi:Domain of unknown function (DUF1707)